MSADATRRVMEALASVDPVEARRCLERALAELQPEEKRDEFGRRLERRADGDEANDPQSALLDLLADVADPQAELAAALARLGPAPSVEGTPRAPLAVTVRAPSPLGVTAPAPSTGIQAPQPAEVKQPATDLAKTLPLPQGKDALAATLGDEPSRRLTLPNIPMPEQVRLGIERQPAPRESGLMRAAARKDWRPMVVGAGLGVMTVLILVLAFGGEPTPPRSASLMAPPAPATVVGAPAETASTDSILQPLAPAPPHPRRAAARKAAPPLADAAPVDDVFGRWK
ncbi:MAG TPA: hypothetical protein VH208_01555 [Myxococcaceae bacterium]|nr:hypothetical protein [Myxococcaceae bacterium]